MKKQVLTLGTALLFVLGSATFIGCENAENHEDEQHMEHMDGEHHEDMGEHHDEEMHGEEQHAMYQCPMKCEGDKMYEEPGQCPKCGMDLKEVE
ncbi:MAG: hypothetical protein KDD29_03850 [Flavobacteriales bacterium]|nr:hypothetical protein [Flavobacteriales bacterium]MCB9334721.1 hypothetical protein [Flavobacteriales bacterium]